MPWHPLPRIAFAVATYPFTPSNPADLPLEIGDELYIIEETPDGNWLRGYLVAPPSLLAGLTSVKGQTLEARVFSGIFPRSCVEVRELLGESEDTEDGVSEEGVDASGEPISLGSDSGKGGLDASEIKKKREKVRAPEVPIGIPDKGDGRSKKTVSTSTVTDGRLSIPAKREPGAPKPPAPVPMLKIGDETPTSDSEPLIDEIASCLREWHSTNLHGLLLSRQYHKLDRLSQLISTLNFSRQQLLHNVLTTWEYGRLREQTVWDLVRVNKLCGGEVIVRDPRERGRVLTGDDSVVEITKLQSVMSMLDEAPQSPTETSALHHLLVDIKGFAGSSTEAPCLVFYVAQKDAAGELTRLSENYTVEVPPGGDIGGLTRTSQLRALFSDLSSADIGDVPSAGETELLLIVKVRAPHQIAAGKPSSRSGPGSHSLPSFGRDHAKPPLSSGNKSMRRSLMWAGKSTRSAFSRGGGKLDPLTEQQDPRPSTGGRESLDGPPGTATSKTTVGSQDGPSYLTADRTVGVGVMKLNAIMKQQEEVEHVISVFSASQSSPVGGVGDLESLIHELVEKKSNNLEKSRGSERLQVTLRSFNHPDADSLIKSTPTLLSGVCKTNKMGFSGAPTKPRSDIYVTIDTAALSKQTLLSKFGGGASSLPSSMHATNLQLTLEVRKSNGVRIDNCIFPSSNSEGLSTFKTVAVERGGAWNQTIRLLLDPKDVSTAHMVVFAADMPHPPFAVAHMPLWDQQAFVRDGAHSLLLYKYDENTATAQPSQIMVGAKGGYLSLPWSIKFSQSEFASPLAVLRLSTYLCSTQFSQDRIILGLIRWKDCPKEDIPTVLKQLIFVPEIEIVKLLNDVLDALFAILVEFSGNDEHEDLVFTALVRVLDIVHDRRFNLGPLVDQYAENRFNYPFATACLVRSFTRLLSKPGDPETARKLRATFKVVRHILKFITHARGQQKAKEAGIGLTGSTPGFTRHLQAIFKALDSMMRSTLPAFVGNQTLAVQHFHTWLPELTGLLTTEEIMHIAIDFMDSCSLVKGKLVLYKLVLIIHYSKLEVFSHPEQRSVLSANTVRWIAPHWGITEEVTDQWKDQIRLCCSVLASQVEHLGPEIPDYIPKILQSYAALQAAPRKSNQRLSLLFPTQYPFPSRPITETASFDESLIELSAILSALSNAPSGMQLELCDDDLSLVVESTLGVHMSILQGEAFPPNWLSVHIFHHKSTMRTLEYLAGILLESFLPEPDEAENFGTELWKIFFTTLLKLVASPSLALETFPEQKRRAVWKIAGDVREQGAELLRRTWEAIGWETTAEERARYGLSKMGGYQVQYVPTLVGPIVELCLSVHEGLRRMAVEVLQTMIVSEWTLSEDLSVIQAEIIDCLDLYLKSKPLTESILQKLFVGELLERFEPLSQVEGDPLFAALTELMGTVDEFLDLLVAVHSDDGSRSGEASHLIHRLRLMEFLRDMQKEEIFINYVHQLAQLQVDARNHAEAGLALRLHADLYEWDPTRTAAALTDPDFPAQSHFERKEKIYFEMIKHFEDGSAWSGAIAAYKELQVQYETNVFDFPKLARTQRATATVYDTIAKSDRLVPKYYRVVFRGLGFPLSVRDKQFIYEGGPHERPSAFTDRIQEQYPSAQIMTTESAVEDVEGQFLIVSAVSPHRDLDHHVYQRARVPQAIREYLVSAHPQSFSVSSKRGTTGPVAEHYAEKVVYVTAEAFPTILRRSEIVESHEVCLGPKETALERIVRKTQEMTGVEKRIADGDSSKELAQLLVDAVSISVNPNSENSVVCYRQLITPDAVENADGNGAGEDEGQDEQPLALDPRENAIKMALVDHAIMLKRCLATFQKSSNEILNRHYADLQQYFETTYAPEIAFFTPPQPARDNNSPLMSPTWSRMSATDMMSPNGRPQGSSPYTHTYTNSMGQNEVSTVKPVSLRQGRGARLSFLGGRKKDNSPLSSTPQIEIMSPGVNGDSGHQNGPASSFPPSPVNGDSTDALSLPSRMASKDNANRRSFFRPNPAEKSNYSVTTTVSANGPPPPSKGSDSKESGDWTRDFSGTASNAGTGNGIGTGPGPGRKSVDGRRSEDKYGGDGSAAADAPISSKGSVRKRFSMLKIGRKGSKHHGTMGSLHEE
ncbi:hypothetical protein RB595_008164 [Gaeumannomyces hyphopodioides]